MHERCKKCGAELINGKCFNCKDLKVIEKGYMMVIDKEELNLYNKKFEVMHKNKNFIWPFILGLMYASFCGHIIIGIAGAVIDVLLIDFFFSIVTVDSFITGFFVICFLIFRILCSLVLNIVCIQID